MRYGIVSDIHSNYEALKAVVHEIDTLGVDALLSLGDIVGYGPNPNECCDLLREREALGIAGNHDEAAASGQGADFFNAVAREAIVWTRSQLTDENKRYLNELPRQRQFDGFDIVHGSPARDFDYIMDARDAKLAFEAVAKPLTFVGHSHVAEVYYQDAAGGTYQQRLKDGGRIDILPEYRYIINVGSVGQPRDRNPLASFGFYDDGARAVEIRRVPYDIHGVQERIVRAHLPPQLGERLALGA
jgi:diadenosine tetraphosphatase ApaH/serine/threonine PP2A family protein phosphatase